MVLKKYSAQTDKNHYFNNNYLTIERWNSYFSQINSVLKIRKISGKKQLKVLEIGCGDKVVSDYLKKNDINVTTVDIDHTLNPDFVDSLPKLKRIKGKYDCVVCFQVLEHLKYEDALSSIRKFKTISKYAVISVPKNDFSLGFYLKIWFLKKINLGITLPLLKSSRLSSPQHLWELGYKEFNEKKLSKDIEKMNSVILEKYQLIENMYHYFILLKFN